MWIIMNLIDQMNIEYKSNQTWIKNKIKSEIKSKTKSNCK